VLDGDPAVPPSPQKKGHRPTFLADVYCDQMAECISIPLPLGKEVRLGPGDIVR